MQRIVYILVLCWGAAALRAQNVSEAKKPDYNFVIENSLSFSAGTPDIFPPEMYFKWMWNLNFSMDIKPW